jgi:hypothetical protein
LALGRAVLHIKLQCEMFFIAGPVALDGGELQADLSDVLGAGSGDKIQPDGRRGPGDRLANRGLTALQHVHLASAARPDSQRSCQTGLLVAVAPLEFVRLRRDADMRQRRNCITRRISALLRAADKTATDAWESSRIL